ncbi:MAG: anthranilate phosphoribosyltransferase [Bdellovibrionota bacterium]
MQMIIEKLLSQHKLKDDELSSIFEQMFTGKLSESQISCFLTAWRICGESKSELYTGAAAMRQHAQKPTINRSLGPLMDNCGTGGDGSQSFNISTAAAIIAASVGCKIAKHGNRSISSKCGSADLLFAAGLPDNLNPQQSLTLLEKTGFTFFFAPNFHPVMKYVMPVRKALGVRTIFNLLGPLANPINPDYQVIGVGISSALLPIAEAAQKLKIKKALVIHSKDGLDEISPADITNGFLVNEDKIEPFTFDPLSVGIKGSLSDLRGGEVEFNLDILHKLLANETVSARDAVILNAATVIWLYGKASSIQDGLEQANKAISSFHTRDFFNQWLEKAREV